LPSFPFWWTLRKEIGIDEIVVVNLIQVTNEWQEQQRLFTCDGGESHAALEEAAMKARAFKIRLRMAPLTPREVGVCSEYPLRNLYISVDGNVSPCVYLYPPVPPLFKTWYCGKEHAASKLSFGNIFEEAVREHLEPRAIPGVSQLLRSAGNELQRKISPSYRRA